MLIDKPLRSYFRKRKRGAELTKDMGNFGEVETAEDDVALALED